MTPEQMKKEIKKLEKAFDRARSHPERKRITRRITEAKTRLADILNDLEAPTH